MAGKWRQLIPHFFAMFVIYFVAIIAVATLFDLRSFWMSLAIALAIAFLYPGLTRRLEMEPEVWSRES